MDSPLIHGQITGTPGDIITTRLYFLVPLSKSQIDFLNTSIVYNINLWSITHINWGILFGLLSLKYPQVFNLVSLVVIHTLFEIWELWAFGYFDEVPLDCREVLDVLFDTLFAVLGFYLGAKAPMVALTFLVVFNVVLFTQ